jgi:hypothetical protein
LINFSRSVDSVQPYLAGGSGGVVLGAAADHGPQHRVEAEAFGVIDVFVAS